LPPIVRHKVVVPVSGIHRGVRAALRYALSLGSDVEAVMVDIDPRRTQEVQEKWERSGMSVPLRVLPSPYRSVIAPLMQYLDGVELEVGFDDPVTLVVPEFVPTKLWHFFLHGQTALLLKIALYFRRRSGHRIAVVTNVPYYFRRADSPVPSREEPRQPVLAPVATLGVLLIGVLIILVVAVSRAWPPLVEALLGIGAVLLTAVLFFLLLIRSIFT
jgi:hypothetical protein